MTNDIGATFRALHQPGNPFILANAWDIGSCKMLTHLGAQAIATSSAAHAFTLGKPDGVTRDEALSHAADLVAATHLPVSGDFENGFGDDPDTCAETVRLAAEIGLAGICIEDTALPSDGYYDFDLAVERIRAASAAARALPNDFFLVARADGILQGTYDLAEAVRRIQAFDAAGADGLYAPVATDPGAIRTLCQATAKPVNALMAGDITALSRDDLAALGVARISLGSNLARATQRTINDAAIAMFERGDFTPLGHSISGGVIDNMLR